MYVYNACFNDQLVYPNYTGNDVTCYEDDVRQHPTSHASLCVDLPERHVPAGLTPATCNALSEVSVALGADVSPQTYDTSKPTTLTVTTSFASDFLDRLREGTCTDVLDWQDVGWTIRWPDGAATSLAGTGHQGATASHTVAPAAGLAGPTAGQVTAVAHLHITGDALDFDPAGNLVTVRRDAFVDVSNRTSANGVGTNPVYSPPQLAAGARPAAQQGDGSVPPPSATALAHVATIRGRLLDLFPDVVVVRPGTESVGGVVVGEARSQVTGWTYLGAVTDAPAGEGALPGQSGGPDQPVGVQYDHAERLDSLGNPLDEEVPLRLRVTTTYPDGHVETALITGSVAVSIYYTALSDTA